MHVRSSAKRSLAASLALCTCALPATTQAIPVREPQGTMHGFLSLQSADGKIIGYGDALQNLHNGRITLRLILHFNDGSLHDETTVFTQSHSFHFISDHLIQRGPLFPKPVDLTLTADGSLKLRSSIHNGAAKTDQTHIDLPANIANGMVPVVVVNLSPHTPQTDLSMVVPHGGGRLVKLKITPEGTTSFTAAGARHTAAVFLIHTELGGIAGLVAPLLDKQPLDGHVYVAVGDAPQLVRLDTQLAEDGPLISIRMAGTVFPTSPAPH